MLHVIATPIGNLGDLSPRAIEAFKTAAVIACEEQYSLCKARAADSTWNDTPPAPGSY